MEENNIKEICLELLKREVCPALGCTEPIALALAVARATEEANSDTIELLEVEVSANILKNGMGVGIPGTELIGLDVAAALGYVCGESKLGLEVLSNVCDKAVKRAKELISQGKVKISVSDSDKKLFIKATITTQGEKYSATIADCHDRVVEVVNRGDVVFIYEEPSDCAGKVHDILYEAQHIRVEDIVNFGENSNFDDIKFILASADMNLALAEEGLRGNYGLNVGKTVANSNHSNIFGNGVMTYAMSLAAAASDARMAGSLLPAMSNSGSGNQGITVTLPVVAVAQKLEVDDEKLARALAISHLCAIHIKGYLGRLSALCGCVVASSGASCGIIYLLGGGYKEVTYAIKNMIGNVTGMVCDGAKTGCALKVSAGVASAIQSAVLAMDGICISKNDGIIDSDIEQTIKNLAKVGSFGMDKTDKVMLDIMLNKK